MNNKKLGFTLIELIVVIVILGILSVIAVPKYMNIKKEARVAALKSFAATFITANESLKIQKELPSASFSTNNTFYYINGVQVNNNWLWDGGGFCGETCTKAQLERSTITNLIDASFYTEEDKSADWVQGSSHDNSGNNPDGTGYETPYGNYYFFTQMNSPSFLAKIAIYNPGASEFGHFNLAAKCYFRYYPGDISFTAVTYDDKYRLETSGC